MSVLFAKRKKAKTEIETPTPIVTPVESPEETETYVPDLLQTFSGLGISEWLETKCSSLGISRPTPVQSNCIPTILKGRDVIGCAPTGSGKTAAFALPILHCLSKDPYGPYALVLTPTRELAFQIQEQFIAFGSAMRLKCCVIVGGVDTLKQSLELDNLPHVIIATPGRLRDHLTRATPPNLSRIQFLVLDEADRLLGDTYSKDLSRILQHLPSKHRQTLLFSATMTSSMQQLETMALKNAYRFDATPTVKTTYLTHILSHFASSSETTEPLLTSKNPNNKRLIEEVLESRNKAESLVPKGRSVIVFVATCRMCQLLSEMLNELGSENVALHSMLSQSRRLAALGKFKSGVTRILLCTDIASRGLDIPIVDLVVNFDLPRESTDYIHRVGRTARIGREGMSISFVSQYDIDVFQNIEKAIDRKMEELEYDEAEVLKRMNEVTTASRKAKLKLDEYGFNDKAQRIRNRRRAKHMAEKQHQLK